MFVRLPSLTIPYVPLLPYDKITSLTTPPPPDYHYLLNEWQCGSDNINLCYHKVIDTHNAD